MEKRKMALAAGGFKPKSSDIEFKDLFIYPRDLWITRGSDERYWKWHWLLLKSQHYEDIEVPQLLQACQLEVKGKVSMSKLTPKGKYEVVFVVMLLEPWESPLTLSLDRPDDTETSCKCELKNMPVNQWEELVVGSFMATGEGNVTFSMQGGDYSHCKKGLVVKYVEIRSVVY